VTGGRIAPKSFLLSEAAEPSVWQARVHKDAFFETEIIAGNAYENPGADGWKPWAGPASRCGYVAWPFSSWPSSPRRYRGLERVLHEHTLRTGPRVQSATNGYVSRPCRRGVVGSSCPAPIAECRFARGGFHDVTDQRLEPPISHLNPHSIRHTGGVLSRAALRKAWLQV
jgi:hypothetical protein